MAEVIANETPRDATADMEVLVFALGGEEYGVDILKVQEIVLITGVEDNKQQGIRILATIRPGSFYINSNGIRCY